MARPALIARSGLEHLAVPGRFGAPEGEAGVTLSVRHTLALASVMARKGTTEALSARVREAFSLDLSIDPRRVSSGTVAFAWAGAGQWLASAEAFEGQAFERWLQDELTGLASVADQSDGRTVIRVAGPRARDVFARGLLIDLHPRAFGLGHAAVTAIGHVGVHVWQVDAAPVYEVAVFRSFAGDFWQWLTDAGAEFGVAVE